MILMDKLGRKVLLLGSFLGMVSKNFVQLPFLANCSWLHYGSVYEQNKWHLKALMGFLIEHAIHISSKYLIGQLGKFSAA